MKISSRIGMQTNLKNNYKMIIMVIMILI